ncbi:unnamed protein product [Closterium sp. Yama58-4]|nr:unnamed protein product [Closterium sp. Yama58-4]
MYACVIFLKGFRPYWWWGLSTGDHPELIKARFASRAREPATLWDNPVKGKWQQCVRPSPAYAEAPLYESTGYLQVFLDGGLNQQRISICNAVAVARLLNATLLIPHFQINPVWLDDSQFEDIFDIEHFMRYLKRDVLIVRQLPHKYRWSTREFYSTGVHQNRIKFAPMHASPEWYLKNVLPKLQRHGVVAIAPFTHRLAFDGLLPDVQRLRCRVNFHALRFVEPVRRLGRILVERLRDPNRRHVKRGVLFGKGGDVSSYGGKGKVGGSGDGALEGEKAAEKEAEDESEKAAEVAAEKIAEMVGKLQEEAGAGADAGTGGEKAAGKEADEESEKAAEGAAKKAAERAGAGSREGGDRAKVVSEGKDEMEEISPEGLAGGGGLKGGGEEEGLGGGNASAGSVTTGNGSAGNSSGERKVEVGEVLDAQWVPVDGLSQIEESDEGEDRGDGEGSAGGIHSGSGSSGSRKEGDAGSSRLLSGRPLLDKRAGWGRKEGKRKKYVAMHLRFDMDMVAHSACDYGETWAEREALSKYREYAWLGRVDKLRFSSDELRLAGKCPLTPEEVGLVLAALGFSAKTRLYVATYQVYGGEKRIAPLRRLFPWLEDKTSLATEEELRPFLGKASLLAALDFYVSRYSDVFVSASLGNMHNVMAAHRAYFGGLKTINFNGTLLATLLAAPPNTLNWNEFVRAVRIGHRSRMGKIKLRRAGQSIYTYPAPDCLCPVDVPPSPPTAGVVTDVTNRGLVTLTNGDSHSAKEAEVATNEDKVSGGDRSVADETTDVRDVDWDKMVDPNKSCAAGMAARGRFGGVKRENEGFDFQYRMSVDNRYKKAAEGRRRLRLLTTLQSLYSFLRVLIAASLMARPLITARLQGNTGGRAVALQVDVKESLAAALGAAAALTGNLASGTSRARVLKLYATLSLMACIAALLPLLTGPLVYPEKWMTVRKSSSSNSVEGAVNLEQLWTAVTTASIAIDMAGALLHLMVVAESESSALKPSEWSDRGGYFTAPSKDLYFYKAGRSMSEGLDDFCPPGFPEAFKYTGRVSRLAMSAIARHLKLRGDFFSALLDDCPLPVGEVSSSVLAATCQRSDYFKPDDAAGSVSEASETEKGLLMLVTADFPGLQVCNSEGVWSPADQGVPPGSLLLLAGRCLHRATAGLCPASTYRVLQPASAGATRCSLSFRLMPRPAAPIDCSPLIHAGHAVPSSMRAVVHAGPFLDSLSSFAHDAASDSKESSMAVACKLEKTSLSSMVVDPASGSLLEDAMIAPCGHSFGGATLSRVIDSMLCPYCMASVDIMTLIPNLAMRSVASCFRPGLSHRAGVKVPKRKRVKEFGDGKDPSEAVKRRTKTEDGMLAGSFEGDAFGRPKGGVQFPFSVNDKVLIKGNKRTPEKFFGREAIITSQCLNGWYLVRMLDTGESVRLQYRSLQKSDGTPLETGDTRLSSSPDAQMERKHGADSTARWWESKPGVGEMSALLQEDEKEDKFSRPISLALLDESAPQRPSPDEPAPAARLEQPPISSTPSHLAVSNAADMAAPRDSQAYLGAHGSSLAKQTQALIAAAAAMEEESREVSGDDRVSGVHDDPLAILPPPAKQMVIKQCQPKSARKRSSHGRTSQVRAQANAAGPPPAETFQAAAFAAQPRAVPRICVDDLLLEDGPPSSSFIRAAETLYLSLAQNGAVILEPARHDAASLCRTLESARLYFRRRADPSSSSASPSFPEQPAWNDGGGYFQAPSKDLYFYKAGRSLNEAISDSYPPGFAESFKYLGKVSRSAMSALARHLKVRCDFFSSLLDDCPLPIGEVSSSVLAASCQRTQSPQDGSARTTPDATEIEKGLLMLVTADFPGLQVCNSEGVWSPADQGVPPGSLLLLAGRCLHRATAGLCPASTYRVLPPASSGTTRCALSFRLMPRPSAVIDCAVLAHAGHAVPAAMRESVCAGAFMDSLSASAADLGSSDRESSLAVSCKLEKSSLASMVSDPVSGSLLEDAMVAQCGHSFGGATLARVMDSMVCPYCMAPVDVMALIPNLAVRSVASCFGKGLPHHTGGGAGAGAKVHKRKRDKDHPGEGKLLPDGSLPQPVKRRPKPEDSGLLGSPDAEGGGRLKGVQFPFSVNEKVLIKGNKRTPEKFFGKEAVITSQCLNGWYLVRVQDSGESTY